MLASMKMALAGSALVALALPSAAKAQAVYVDQGYGYPAYGQTYAEPYGWGGGPFWPVGAVAGAAAGVVGAAANLVAAPFVGWRDGYYIDDRIDPAGGPYGYGYRDGYGYGYASDYGYGGSYAPSYGDVPVSSGYVTRRGGWGGYVATYRGKVKGKPHMMRHVSAKPAKHGQRDRMAVR